jgi:hypothetical protein
MSDGDDLWAVAVALIWGVRLEGWCRLFGLGRSTGLGQHDLNTPSVLSGNSGRGRDSDNLKALDGLRLNPVVLGFNSSGASGRKDGFREMDGQAVLSRLYGNHTESVLYEIKLNP